jgi:hypothetical protein
MYMASLNQQLHHMSMKPKARKRIHEINLN